MWRRLCGCHAFRHIVRTPETPSFLTAIRPIESSSSAPSSPPSAAASIPNNSESPLQSMTFGEAKKLMRLVNVEALKMKLGMEGKEVITYPELLDACQTMGLARSLEDAIAFARVLDDAGVVLLFRDKVYLHPDKVASFLLRPIFTY